MLRRYLVFAAVLVAVATTVVGGIASASVQRSASRSMDSMDMDMGMDHGMGDHGKNAPTVAGAREIKVTARSFKFSPNKITVSKGENVTVVLRSVDILHDFVVKGEGHIVAVKGKKTARGGLMIDKPGTYKFWCSVSGHRKAGMRGTIVVT